MSQLALSDSFEYLWYGLSKINPIKGGRLEIHLASLGGFVDGFG